VPGIGVWAAVTAAYAASLIVFFVTDRYQLPLLVPLAIAGSGALSYLWTSRRTPSRLVLPLATIALSAFVANVNLGLNVARSEERTRMSIALIERGDATRAEALLARGETDNRNPGAMHYRAGLAYANRHEFDAAIKHLRRALEIKPALVEADLLLGQVLLDSGHTRDAIPYLRRAMEHSELRDAATVELVKALTADGQHEAASKLLAQFAPPTDAGADTLIALGAIALELRQPSDAIRFLETALAAKPADPTVMERLAVARSLAGDLNGAVSALEKALQLTPESASLHLNLGVTYARLGRIVDARREAVEALRLRPDYPAARSLLERLQRSP
jgi:tetratricopeptide (TPR) repeat protein